MSITLAILAVILICSSKISKGMYDGYIECRQTKAINGIFIILVFLRHFNQYVGLDGILDIHFLYVNSALGQLIVTTFMFYSGYGVIYSVLKKSDYVDGMLKNRILKTLILFDIAILLYVVMNIIFGVKMTISQIILSFIGWSGVGNSTWYLFAILMMYLLTYLAFKVAMKAEGNIVLGLAIATVLIAGYVLVIRKFKDSQYYNTVFCYAMGLWYGYFKPKIDDLMSKKNVYYVIMLATVVIFAVSVWLRDTNLLVNQMYYLLFVAVVVLVSMKVKINSPVLKWCGENLFGLYILQRLPMIVLQQSTWMLSNPYVYFVLCVIITVCLTIVYRHIVIDKVQILFKRC